MGSQIGAFYTYPERIIKIVEDAGNKATVSVDGKSESICPPDRLTLRFELTELPGEVGSEVVFAIIPQESGLTAPSASFRIRSLRVYECQGDSCVRPKQTETPPDATAINCVAYDNGTIKDFVELNSNLHFAAVPSNYASKEVYLGAYWASHRPWREASGFRINSTNYRAEFVFSNGIRVTMPDHCKHIQPQNALGSQWAELHLYAKFERFDLSGRLIETRNEEDIVSRWDWTVVDHPPLPKLTSGLAGTREHYVDQAALIQSSFIEPGAMYGNFEVLVTEGEQFCHWYLANKIESPEWMPSQCFGLNIRSGPAVIESTFSGDGNHGNFEVVAQVVDKLCHFWRNNTLDPQKGYEWNGPTECFGENIASTPALIQSTFHGTGEGNFEVVVRQIRDGQSQLCHYWRNNTWEEGKGYAWSEEPTWCFGENVTSAPTLIQSSFGTDEGMQGNLRLLSAREHNFATISEARLLVQSG